MNEIKKKIKKYDLSRFTILRRLPLILSLTRRGVFFFLFVLIAQLLLFFTGNIQNFLDENLRLIVIISSLTSIGMMLFSLAAVFECLYYGISKRKKHFFIHMVIFFAAFLFALGVCIFTNTVIILSDGTGAF